MILAPRGMDAHTLQNVFPSTEYLTSNLPTVNQLEMHFDGAHPDDQSDCEASPVPGCLISCEVKRRLHPAGHSCILKGGSAAVRQLLLPTLTVFT